MGYPLFLERMLMISLIGFEENIQNIICLSTNAKTLEKIETYVDLKEEFRKYLNSFQKTKWTKSDSAHFEMSEKNKIIDCISNYKSDSSLNDLHQETVIDLQSLFMDDYLIKANLNKTMIENSIEQLNQYDENLKTLIDLTIFELFYAASSKAFGGSSSTAIGLIWTNFQEHHTLREGCEFLVHEMAHNLLFIDERRHVHYLDFDEIADPNNFFQSAILKKRRPLDKVIHSLVVAYEVISFRQSHFLGDSATLIHPSTEILKKQVKATIQDLRDGQYEALVTQRVIDLVESISLKIEKGHSYEQQLV